MYRMFLGRYFLEQKYSVTSRPDPSLSRTSHYVVSLFRNDADERIRRGHFSSYVFHLTEWKYMKQRVYTRNARGERRLAAKLPI